MTDERDRARAAGAGSSRALRFPIFFLALLTFIPFALPLFRGELFAVRDHFDYFQPLRWFTANELLSGRLPLWNQYSASGEAWLANPQTGVFYPPSWLFLLLPFPAAYMLFLYLHLLLLGVGAYLLFFRFAGRGGALVGAVALVFSGPALSLLDVSNNLATVAWVPLVLHAAAFGGWARGALYLTLCFLGGEPYFAALAAAGYCVVAFLSERGSMSAVMKKIALAGVAAVGLSAIQLVPFLELVRGSDRAVGMDRDLILLHSVTLRDWIGVVLPSQILDRVAVAGPTQQFIPQVYCGLIVVLLAIAGCIARRALPVVIGCCSVLALALVLGSGPEVLAKLPLTVMRYPARMLPVAAFAVAALAALGWSRLRRENRALDLLLVLLITVDLFPRSVRLFESAPFRPTVVPYASNVGAASKILRVGDVEPALRPTWMSGYLNLYEKRYEVFTAAPLASERYVGMHRQLQSTPTREQLSTLAVGWILTRHLLHRPFVPVASDRGVTMYRYDRATPMATLRIGRQLHRVESWSVDGSTAKVVVDAPAPGIVVLSQRHVPGWHASVDGEKVKSLVVEGLFRGVRVAAGRHEIVWSYRPASLIFGATMTLVTLAAMLLRYLFHKRER